MLVLLLLLLLLLVCWCCCRLRPHLSTLTTPRTPRKLVEPSPRHLCLLSVPRRSRRRMKARTAATKTLARLSFLRRSSHLHRPCPSSSAIVITADDAGADADADVDIDVDVDADTDADTGADGCTLLTAAKATLAAHELGFAATTEDNDDAVAEDDGPASLAAASVIDEVPDTAAPAVASATCWLFCCCGCCGCCCVAADDDDAADTAGGLVGRAVLRVLPMPQGSRGSRFTDGGEFDDAPPPLASLLLAASLPPLPPLARSCC